MGHALDSFRAFLEKLGLKVNQRTATSLLVLIAILILLPIGVFLVRNQQTIFPRAADELIQLGEGGCIKINKAKVKAVDCGLVPLKLVNPFFKIKTPPPARASETTNSSSNPSSSNPSSSSNPGKSPVPSVSNSAKPSPSPSAPVGPPQNVSVRNFNNDIQGALDSIKLSGGSVYVPSGTYETLGKIRLYSNTTVFGDGMGKTIIKLSPNAVVSELMGNDSTAGLKNVTVRDLTLQGPDIAMRGGCCHGLELENLDGGYVINVEVKDVGMDGIYLGYKSKDGGLQGVRNVRISGCKVAFAQRQQIGVIEANNVVIDNCTIDGTNKHGSSQYAGIDLEPDASSGRTTNVYMLDNDISKSNIGIALSGTKGESGNASTVSNNKVCSNSIDANTIGISDSGSNNFIINNQSSNNEFNSSTKTSPSSQCNMPSSLSSLPSAPSKPSAQNPSLFSSLIGEVSAQGSNEVLYRLAETEAGLEDAEWKVFASARGEQEFALSDLIIPEAQAQNRQRNRDEDEEDENEKGDNDSSGDQDSDDQFLDAQDADSADQFTQSQTSQPPQSPRPNASASFPAGAESINTNFQLTNTDPGPKQIWVQFLHPDGASKTASVNFNLIDKPPLILGLSCNLDVSRQNLQITFDGERFGNTVGTIEGTVPATKPEVLGWNDNKITAVLKKPSISITDGQRFKFKLLRGDGIESSEAVCAVNKSLVSLGARIFCREPGKFDASDVAVNLIYAPDPSDPDRLNKIEEKVTINADGEIADLKTQLQVGRNYGIAIQAPNSLRRSTVFTAVEGTSQIVQSNGDPFILPIGDIAPKINPDGQINALDRSELLRQWRILGQTSVELTGDFNRDTRVNSIDWACMNYDFGSSSDPIPVSVPQSTTGSIHIPGGASPIPGASSSIRPGSSPAPSPSRDTTNSVRVDVGGGIFLDTNRSKSPDPGESFISIGSAVVRLLQLPEDHVTGTPLTQDELNNSTVLAETTNNLPGGSYDLSVFVENGTSNKFALTARANNGQLEGSVDFSVGPPLANANFLIDIPVVSRPQ